MSEVPNHWTVHESPIGPLTLVAGSRGLTGLEFPGRRRVPDGATKKPMPAVTEQLDAYFAGELRAFDLPLDPQGTPLQKAVWRALLEIPYGETASYGEQAARIDPELFDSDVEPWQRARVVGADGSLTGYGGGLDRKRALLDLERRTAGAGEQTALI
ncbi:MAG TPA: methylated-DNA--[protein]-cysteine S-methyltransferase [Solirubrobacterales bacterium]|nr:methylated-DNA--[protein]-cysteine S-methyltransferase [Solirubrobacterales bacterium]